VITELELYRTFKNLYVILFDKHPSVGVKVSFNFQDRRRNIIGTIQVFAHSDSPSGRRVGLVAGKGPGVQKWPLAAL